MKGNIMNKHNPDNRNDNVENIERNITSTIENIRLGNEMTEKTSDEKLKMELMAKNERRKEALEAMRKEIQDEASARESQYERDNNIFI